jgi:hypothetical protein
MYWRVTFDHPPLNIFGPSTGPIHFGGSDTGQYERRLLFDNVVAAKCTDARDRFEAFARSGRDVLSQRWTLTHGSVRDMRRAEIAQRNILVRV